MVNEPLPHHLTVRVLRDLIDECDGSAVVGIALSRTDLVDLAESLAQMGDLEMDVLMNLRVARASGPIVQMRLSRPTEKCRSRVVGPSG